MTRCWRSSMLWQHHQHIGCYWNIPTPYTPLCVFLGQNINFEYTLNITGESKHRTLLFIVIGLDTKASNLVCAVLCHYKPLRHRIYLSDVYEVFSGAFIYGAGPGCIIFRKPSMFSLFVTVPTLAWTKIENNLCSFSICCVSCGVLFKKN